MTSYRPVLEVLKLTPIFDIQSNLSLVSALWCQACASEELWITLGDRIGLTPSANQTYKHAYIASVRLRASKVWVLSLSQLCVYSLPSHSWTATALRETIEGYNYAYTLLDTGSVLCCGGYTYDASIDYQATLDTAYAVSATGMVTALPPMIRPRFFHGILTLDGRAMVFGGMSGYGSGFGGCSMTECESFSHGMWSPMPPMALSRYEFTPTKYRHWVYLCGGWNCSIEVLDTNQMSITMVTGVVLDASRAIAVVCGLNIVVLTEKSVVGISIRGQGSTRYYRQAVSLSVCTPPVLYKESIYVVDLQRLTGYHQIDIHTGLVSAAVPYRPG